MRFDAKNGIMIAISRALRTRDAEPTIERDDADQQQRLRGGGIRGDLRTALRQDEPVPAGFISE